MIIPGGNILNMAMRVIARQPFIYMKFLERTVNDIGLDEPVYAAGINASGSVQPVPRNVMQYMGLDMQRQYFYFFLEKGIIDIARDVGGDHFVFQERKFQCLSKTDWFGVDGWDQVLTVEVPGGCAC